MNDIEQALAQISDIRSTLAASTRFRGFAPEVLLLAAGASLLLAIAQTIWPDKLAANDVQHVILWGSLLAIAGVTVTLEAVYRGHALHGDMAGSMLRTLLSLVIPYVAVQTVIGAVICYYAPQVAWLIPGLWQLLVSLVCHSFITRLPRSVIWVARWYFLCGTIVLILAAQTGHLSPWMMGIPFAVGHALLAYFLRHSGETQHVH